MDAAMGFLAKMSDGDATLAAVNERLAEAGLAITREEARMLEARRSSTLAEVERVEFGVPAVALLAQALAGSVCLTKDNVADVLAGLQDAFYALRDELPVEVPDAEIAEALRGCLDEWGDVSEVARASVAEVMAHSAEYLRAQEAAASEPYRIVDDEGRVYEHDPAWDYDEQADGWGGEKWAGNEEG